MAAEQKPGRKGEKSQPGAVGHDKRGNAVWQWAVDTGKHALDSTSALLRRLDVPGLSIEDDKPPAAPETRVDEPGVDKGAGYDPYGRAKAKPPAAPAADARKLSSPVPAPESRRSSWWRRLLGLR